MKHFFYNKLLILIFINLIFTNIFAAATSPFNVNGSRSIPFEVTSREVIIWPDQLSSWPTEDTDLSIEYSYVGSQDVAISNPGIVDSQRDKISSKVKENFFEGARRNTVKKLTFRNFIITGKRRMGGFTSSYFYRIIKKCKTSLKVIEFISCEFDEDVLGLLKKAVNLTAINLSGSKLSIDIMAGLTKTLKRRKIKHLNLSFCLGISTPCMYKFINNFPTASDTNIRIYLDQVQITENILRILHSLRGLHIASQPTEVDQVMADTTVDNPLSSWQRFISFASDLRTIATAITALIGVCSVIVTFIVLPILEHISAILIPIHMLL